MDEMKAIDAQNKAAAAAAASQCQLDRSAAANASTSSAPAKKQRTLAKQQPSFTATRAWLSAFRPWSREIRHQHEKSSATMRRARVVLQRTVAATMRIAAAMRSKKTAENSLFLLVCLR